MKFTAVVLALVAQLAKFLVVANDPVCTSNPYDICTCEETEFMVVETPGPYFFHVANAASMNCALASISSAVEHSDALKAIMDAGIQGDTDLWVGTFLAGPFAETNGDPTGWQAQCGETIPGTVWFAGEPTAISNQDYISRYSIQGEEMGVRGTSDPFSQYGGLYECCIVDVKTKDEDETKEESETDASPSYKGKGATMAMASYKGKGKGSSPMLYKGSSMGKGSSTGKGSSMSFKGKGSSSMSSMGKGSGKGSSSMGSKGKGYWMKMMMMHY